MKQLGKYLPAFLLAVTLTSVMSYAQESTDKHADDSVITTRVKAAIFNEPILKFAEINVETFYGDVQLSGFTSSHTAEYKAVELARSVKGVVSVINYMQVK